MKLGDRQRRNDREALAERAAGVEVGRHRNRGPRVDERPRRRHRPVEKERARRQKNADDIARGEHSDAGVPGRLEMIDGPGAELDRQRDRTLLGELIAVQAKSEPRGTASLEVAASLVDVERPLLEKDIRARGQPRSFRQDFGEREVEIGIGVLELRRHSMGTEPGGDPAGFPDRA